MAELFHCDCGQAMTDTGERFYCPACDDYVSYAVIGLWVWDAARELAELL